MAPATEIEPSERVRRARRLFAGIADDYERMASVLSYGRDAAWRRFLVSRVPPGSRVLDVATGTASVGLELVRAGAAAVVGLDPSEPMLRRASGRIRGDLTGRSIDLVRGRAERLPFPDGSFDALTFTYLLRYVDDPAATLAELARVVRPGGVIASLEFGVPRTPLWRAGWRAQTRVALPLLGRMASREWYETGRFLGPSIEQHRRAWPPEREAEAWEAAGIVDVRVRELTLGAGVVVWGVRGAAA